MKKWFMGFIMALNQFANALLGGNPDEPVSSRLGRARENGSKPAAIVCEVLDWVDFKDADGPEGDHCTFAINHHISRLKEELEVALPYQSEEKNP